MRNDLQHPVITRLRAYGYEYVEPEAHYCCTCGEEVMPDFFGEYPEECWDCRHRKEEDDEEVAS